MPKTRNHEWIVCQLGAREHYVIASELDKEKILNRLFTDIWCEHDNSWGLLCKYLKRLGFSVLAKKLRGRRNSCINRAVIGFYSVGKFALAELSYKIILSSGLDTKHRRNINFDNWVACHIDKEVSLERCNVFAYSYAAFEIAKKSKEKGFRFVLGQIDGGPAEQELVLRVMRSYGLEEQTNTFKREAWSRWKKECELADVIIANSNWTVKLLAESGIDISKCQVVPLAYSSEVRPRVKNYTKEFSLERPMRVLFLGQVIARKGVVELCNAMKRFDDSSIVLRLVGPVDSNIKNQISNTHNVKVFGAVPRSEVASHYEWADVFILPTHSDGFAITQVEAMSFGLPVIASPYCGDVVIPNINGLRIEAVNPELIQNALQYFFINPESVESMSKAAVGRVADFHPTKIINQLIEVSRP